MARLKLYRRHLAACPHKSKGTKFDRCKCPIWVRGTWAGEAIRKSLDVDSWEKAEKLKRDIEHGNHQPKSITIQEALDTYVTACELRNLSTSTLKKYRLLRTRLSHYAGRERLRDLRSLDVGHVNRYRSQWKLSPLTAAKEIGFLRAFFSYCIQNGWISSNPAKAIKLPQLKLTPRLPFSEKEIQNIISKAEDDRELGFILTLRHTGLRIGDASFLKVSQVSDGRVHLYTTKAGTPVSILIPDTLASLLKALPTKGGYFFLRGESVHPHTVPDLWRKRIKAICKELKIAPAHPHRFRHSLACELLNKGATVEQVAAILGNSPAIVAKVYSTWVASRQANLDDFLRKTWEQPKLALVKK